MKSESLIFKNNPGYRYQLSLNGSYYKPVYSEVNLTKLSKGLNNMSNEIFNSRSNYYKQIFDTTPEAILIFDESDNIIDSNEGFQKMFSFSSSETKGKHLDELITPSNLTGETKNIINELRKGISVRKETTRTSKDGSMKKVLISGNIIELENSKMGIYLTYIDISVQKLVEEQIKASLIEKEVLIREVHHRVKNNLQIISSLLNLQSKSIEEKAVDELFIECQNRVKAISLVHEKLYQTNSITRIDFDRYIKCLAAYIMNSYGISQQRIKILINAENVFLNMDTAIPCGLIINELVTNSIKHAFESGMNGEISIEMKYTNENSFILAVKDNGKGFPEDLLAGKGSTLGISIIQSLVRQIDAKLEITKNNGTEFKITFSILKNRGGINR